MIFATGSTDLCSAIAVLNSKVGSTFLQYLCPTLDFNPGALLKIPVPDDALSDITIRESCQNAIQRAEQDWNSQETAPGFGGNLLVGMPATTKLEETYRILRDKGRSSTMRLLEIERRINHSLLDHYSLADDIPIELADDEITLVANPQYRYGADRSESELEALLLADTMREFISYAVGCMLGRYSLDKPGLILANQGETSDDYRQQIPEPTFAPDDDNVIPLLDGDWFTDDISERFKEFLKVTSGEANYDKNLTFLENALFPENATGKKRKDIRHYFLKEFYEHHWKLYKKRPIYWLFSSPKGTFNALIYMHRYRPDLVSTVLQYLRDFRDKLAHRQDHQQMVADSAASSKSEQSKALKEVAAIKKQLKELEDYERDTLFPLAQQKIEIDLDDGVKHNYALFGKALKKVAGLSAK